jgi:hypothetical protein
MVFATCKKKPKEQATAKSLALSVDGVLALAFVRSLGTYENYMTGSIRAESIIPQMHEKIKR